MANPRILIVDDSPVMRRIMVNTLKKAGFEQVEEAGDGQDALDKLKAGQFDFILTDWNMPVMDGLAFVSAVRSDEALKNLPVLMVTTRGFQEDVMEALKAGVNSYITKPFTPEIITKKIVEILEKVQTAR